jgi:hypothetical protein
MLSLATTKHLLTLFWRVCGACVVSLFDVSTVFASGQRAIRMADLAVA